VPSNILTELPLLSTQWRKFLVVYTLIAYIAVWDTVPWERELYFGCITVVYTLANQSLMILHYVQS